MSEELDRKALHDKLLKYFVMSRYFEHFPFNTYQEYKEQEKKAIDLYRGFDDTTTIPSSIFSARVRKEVANVMNIFEEFISTSEHQ